MVRRVGPRADSVAHKILLRLVDLGGTATKATLMPLLSRAYQTNGCFQSQVVQVLEHYGFVIADEHALAATPAGKNYVGAYIERTTPVVLGYVGEVAKPRSASPNRPLNIGKHMPRMPVRDGALEFLDIPSVMGSQRIFPADKRRQQ